MRLVYFSNISENTKRFVHKLDYPTEPLRIPTRGSEELLMVDEPFILITPTYGSGVQTKVVPKQVVKFLNQHHPLIRGVIAGGNTNFGPHYALAGDIIAAKCKVPFLDKFELLGTPYDVERISKRLEEICLL